jgi:hypothetical protein
MKFEVGPNYLSAEPLSAKQAFERGIIQGIRVNSWAWPASTIIRLGKSFSPTNTLLRWNMDLTPMATNLNLILSLPTDKIMTKTFTSLLSVILLAVGGACHMCSHSYCLVPDLINPAVSSAVVDNRLSKRLDKRELDPDNLCLNACGPLNQALSVSTYLIC